MKLFCAKCEKEITDNIVVFENVDGALVHCADCMFPILFVPFDEPGWFGNPSEGTCTVKENVEAVNYNREEQPSLFDTPSVTEQFNNKELRYLKRLLITRVKTLANKYVITDTCGFLQPSALWKKECNKYSTYIEKAKTLLDKVTNYLGQEC